MNQSITSKRLWQAFVNGFIFVAPLIITLTFLLWLAGVLEALMGTIIKVILPADWYIPGLGLFFGLFFTVLTGLLANVYIVRWWVKSLERLMDNTPVIKYLYQASKDITRLISSDPQQKLGEVVAVTLHDTKMIGFVIQKDTRILDQAVTPNQNLLAVFIPMSYQMGGFTLYLSENQITRLDIAAGDALRAILTGGSFNHSEQTSD